MEFHFNLFSWLEISICSVRHIIFLQDKCAVFHVPKLDQKKAINHVMAWERKQRSDLPLSLSLFLCSQAPPLSSPLPFLPYLISTVKPPPSPFLHLLSSIHPPSLFPSLFWTALLSHIFLSVTARLIFSLWCCNFKQKQEYVDLTRYLQLA